MEALKPSDFTNKEINVFKWIWCTKGQRVCKCFYYELHSENISHQSSTECNEVLYFSLFFGTPKLHMDKQLCTGLIPVTDDNNSKAEMYVF